MSSVTINEARDAVYERFLAQWTATPATAYTFENEKFDPPAGIPWVRVTVRNIGSTQACLGPPGNRRFRRSALGFAQIFTPADTGTKDSDTLAAAFAAIFEAVSFDGLDFRAASSREVGVDDGWHLTLVEVPFEYEEIK